MQHDFITTDHYYCYVCSRNYADTFSAICSLQFQTSNAAIHSIFRKSTAWCDFFHAGGLLPATCFLTAGQSWISTTIQRETKLFLGADNEETAELTVPMYDFGDWASRMKAYRKKNHITQQELAQLMGVKHFTLRSWEQKQAKPPYNVWRLHKHLFDDSIKLT